MTKKNTQQTWWWIGGLVGAVGAYYLYSDWSADKGFQLVWPGAQDAAPSAAAVRQELGAAGVVVLGLTGPHFDTASGVPFYIVNTRGGGAGVSKPEAVAALGWG